MMMRTAYGMEKQETHVIVNVFENANAVRLLCERASGLPSLETFEGYRVSRFFLSIAKIC